MARPSDSEDSEDCAAGGTGAPALGTKRAPLLAALVLGWGCTPDPCQQGDLPAPNGDRSQLLFLDDDDLDGAILLQVLLPDRGEARYAEGAPVALYVHGSWTSRYLPLEGDAVRINGGNGIASIYLNLPGGDGLTASPGVNDYRGSNARRALAAALRYAAGQQADVEGCTVHDRIPDGAANGYAIAGYSNGGNLVWSTLADEALDVPAPVGVATFETPISGQFVLVEPGTTPGASPLYDEGRCALGDDGAMRCDFDYSRLDYDAEVWPSTNGALFIDEDGDGALDDHEFRLATVQDPTSGAWLQSVEATEAARELGLELPGRASVEQAIEWWSEREAPQALAAATALFPETATIVVGTEEDHVVTGATGHEHITGLLEAASEAGLPWTRLDPDAAYVTAITGSTHVFPETPANQAVTVGDEVELEPADVDAVRGSHYLTAAVLELLDRAYVQDWHDDLDAVLVD